MQIAPALHHPLHHPFPPTAPSRLGLLAVAGAHIALIAALLQLGVLPRVAADIAPLTVTLLDLPRSSAEAVAPPLPAPAVRPPSVEPLPLPPSVTMTPSAVPAPLAPAAPDAPSTPSQAPPAVAAAPAPAAITPAPTPAMPTARRQLPASAVAYRVPPAAELPRASRRAGESGTVWLRVVVDTAGLPAQVTVHRSSGYARLDEQALLAMRAARFHPHVENGRPVEVDVIAPIEYPAE